jgi:hypothetical protein
MCHSEKGSDPFFIKINLRRSQNENIGQIGLQPRNKNKKSQ